MTTLSPPSSLSDSHKHMQDGFTSHVSLHFFPIHSKNDTENIKLNKNKIKILKNDYFTFLAFGPAVAVLSVEQLTTDP